MAEPLDGTPLQFRHLTKVQQGRANHIVSNFGSTFSEKARAAGKAQTAQYEANPIPENVVKRAKGRRLTSIADEHVDKPLTLRSAATNRVDAVNSAATTQRGAGESMAGAGWYFDAHAKIAKTAANVPVGVAAAASSAMSPGANPKSERTASGAMAAAHSNPKASVHFSSALVGSLRAAGHGVPVPVGATIPFSKVPAHLVPVLAHENHRAEAKANSTGVDWASIGQVASTKNVAKAQKIMSGETPLSKAQNPYGAPKTASYTDNLTRAIPGTPQHMEYQMRADDIGSAIRAKHGQSDRVPGQQMLDYHGLRDSKEGVLSDNGHTAEDSWMRAISVGHANPKTMKGAGDINPTRKSYTTHDTVGDTTTSVVHSVSREAQIKPTSVYHAWNNEATHKAAESLQSQHGLDYSVPSTMVQETAWTAKRREVGADSEWNAQNRASAKSAKAEAKANRTPTPTTSDLLPGMNTPSNKALAKGSAATSRQAQFHLDR
jgi:hypothetical protein